MNQDTSAFGGEIERARYALRVLSENEIPHLVRLRATRLDGEERFEPETAGLVTLERIAERRALGFDEIRRIFDTLEQLLPVLEEYLLEPGGIVLEPGQIRFGGGDVFFFYDPDRRTDPAEGIRLLASYLMKHADHRDGAHIRTVYELVRLCSEEGFRLSDVTALLAKPPEPPAEEEAPAPPPRRFRITAEDRLNAGIREIAGIAVPVLFLAAEVVLYFRGFLAERPAAVQAAFYLCVLAAGVCLGRLVSPAPPEEPEPEAASVPEIPATGETIYEEMERSGGLPFEAFFKEEDGRLSAPAETGREERRIHEEELPMADAAPGGVFDLWDDVSASEGTAGACGTGRGRGGGLFR